MFWPLRARTGACGVYSIHEWSLISLGWTGSGCISSVKLLAAAAVLDVVVSLFVGGGGRIHGFGSTFVR